MTTRAGGLPPERAMNFELQDRLGRTLAYRFPKGRVRLLTPER